MLHNITKRPAVVCMEPASNGRFDESSLLFDAQSFWFKLWTRDVAPPQLEVKACPFGLITPEDVLQASKEFSKHTSAVDGLARTTFVTLALMGYVPSQWFLSACTWTCQTS